MKLKKGFKRLLTIFLLIGFIFVTTKTILKSSKEINNKEIKYNSNEQSKTLDINLEEYITDNSESNKSVIKEYIAEGMDLEDFKKIFDRKIKYVEKKGSYEEIEYNFERHYKYSELEDIYEKLSLSEIVKLETIGTSYDGRNLYSIEIGTGEDQIMLEGNIHAAEIAPALYLTKFAVDLVNDWENNDKDIRKLLSEHKFIILPTANPDGYDYSLFGSEIINNTKSYVYKNDDDIDEYYIKSNINGVDLNRNFPSQFGGINLKGYDLYYTVARDKSPSMYRYFPGYNVGSEPETQAMIYWMYKNYQGTHAYLSIHSAGQVIYNGKPFSSYDFGDYTDECAEIINYYTDYNMLGIDAEIDGDGTDGTSTDMITEIAHGYKFSSKTGRLSTSKYKQDAKSMKQNMCVLTIETLENYTQNLKTIKSEWNDKYLKKAFIAIAELELD